MQITSYPFHQTDISWFSSFHFRDCSLFMPKGGGAVFRVGGVKIFKINEKGGVFFKIQIRGGGKFLETVVSTLV